MFSIEDIKLVFERKANTLIDPKSFYAILEGIPVSVVICDALQEDCPIIYVNKVFELVTGYLEKEAIGRNCRFLQGPNTNQVTVLEIKKAILEGYPINVTILNYKKDGTTFNNELIIVPIYIEGKKRYFVAIQNDLSRPLYK